MIDEESRGRYIGIKACYESKRTAMVLSTLVTWMLWTFFVAAFGFSKTQTRLGCDCVVRINRKPYYTAWLTTQTRFHLGHSPGLSYCMDDPTQFLD
jgi:hypothetical protein